MFIWVYMLQIFSGCISTPPSSHDVSHDPPSSMPLLLSSKDAWVWKEEEEEGLAGKEEEGRDLGTGDLPPA